MPKPARPQASPRLAHAGARRSNDFKASRTLITWQDAESVALEHMVHLGFADALLTGQGADGGLDVTGARAAAQVKHHGTPVSAPQVQQLAGAAHRHEIKLFYATVGYTTQAKQFADTAGVHLFTIFPNGHVVPENPAARALSSTAADCFGDPFERRRLQRARRAEEDHQLYCSEVSARGNLLVSMVRPLASSRSRRERKRAEKAIASIKKSIDQLERGLDGSRSLRERRVLAKGADRQLKSIAKEIGVKLK